MRTVKQKNTGPEIAVRKLLYSMGFRYRLHSRNLPGSPDIVLTKRKIVIFVHGCFWHRHPGCKHASSPKANKDYWEPKFDGNVRRDEKKERQLKELGWRVITVWECQTRELYNLRQTFAQLLGVSSERD